MGNNRLKIHYTFYIFLFFIIYFNNIKLFLAYFIALFIHEYSHYLLSKTYNKMSQNITIYPFGMNVSVNMCNQNQIKKISIFLIGPLVNILLLLCTIVLWWCYPISFYYTRDFAFANFCLGVFNLIPIYPLDGGNIVLNLFISAKLKQKVLKIMKILAIIVSVFFMLLFILSCFYKINFSCFCISLFLVSTLFNYDEILNQKMEEYFCKKTVREYKSYVIKLDTKYDDIKKYFSDIDYVEFYLMDDQKRIIKIINQDEIKNLFHKNLI